ncbi:MAG: D-aminoacyl-tRNA deacylase [Nitrososphaeraceae archaeon]
MNENIALIASLKDEAGMNMVNFLTFDKDFHITSSDPLVYKSRKYRNVTLYLTDRDLLFIEDYNVGERPTSFVFLSRHRSAGGIASLTCHSTGNFSPDNSYGGEPTKLGMANPSMLKAYFNELHRNRNFVPDYQITLEATHHGPTSLEGPILFVEIGSGLEQWRDSNASRIVCNCVLDVSSLCPRGSSKVALALGGTHYPDKLNKILLETDFSVAYIATKNNLQFIDDRMIQHMIVRSTERITHVLLDWKGLGKYKRSILDTLEKTDLEIVRI